MNAADGLATPRRYWAMLAIGIGIAMAVLDSSVANIALPTIARQLHASPAQAVWVINAYQIAMVVTLLPLASLGERLGYRRVYQAGLVVFTASSLACALSHSLTALVLARLAQGLGAAGILSVNGALVRFICPQASFGRGLGLNALIVATCGAIGPSVASAILSVGPWEWLFAVNVPFGLINLGLAARALPSSERSRQPFDWTSAALNALMFGLFFIGADTFTHGRDQGLVAAVEVTVAGVVGAVLVRRALRAPAPLIPIDLLRIPVFALSVAASILAFAGYVLAFVTLPFHFEAALHRGQVQTGLLMTPWPVALGLVSPIGGRLADRYSGAVLGAIGMGVLAFGLVALATLGPDPSTLDIVWRVALGGAGFGLFQPPNNRLMLLAAPRSRAGAAGGVQATARTTGMVVGATLATLIFRLASQHAETLSLALGAALAVAAAGCSLLRQPSAAGVKRRSRRSAEANP